MITGGDLMPPTVYTQREIDARLDHLDRKLRQFQIEAGEARGALMDAHVRGHRDMERDAELKSAPDRELAGEPVSAKSLSLTQRLEAVRLQLGAIQAELDDIMRHVVAAAVWAGSEREGPAPGPGTGGQT